MSSFDSSLKGKYYEDVDGDDVFTAGIDNPVNEYGSRLDANGVSTHVKATAAVKPRTKAPVDFSSPFDFGSTTALELKADNTLAGQMRDCAECHVGGGAMQYVPKSGATDLSAGTCIDVDYYRGASYTNDAATNSLGVSTTGLACDATTTQSVCGEYTTPYGPHEFKCVPNPANQRTSLRDATFTGVTAFNYFIDQYDEDEDGVLGEVLPQDYSQTGVLEMDCLMCHLEGYAYQERNEVIRKGKFDASRAVGAEVGTAVTGTTVAYDPAVVGINTDGQLTLGESGMHVHGMPSANCSNCHADMHAVDWKKRGDSWGVPYVADVHGALECVSCHTRKGDADPFESYRSYVDATSLTGKGGSNVLGHDPAKGVAPYSSLWNATDNTMKTCVDCHLNADDAGLGAVDPTPRHEALGLTSLVLQTGTDGTRNANHIDILDCTACHVRKLGTGPTAAEGGVTHGSLYEWGTGGAMVDSTGPDAEGRVTDHENLYVERTMEDNLALAWQGGKLIKTNALVTMFWRDKDESFLVGGAPGYVDINADGQTGGMDAVNPSHVRDAMAALGIDALTVDGVIDAAEVQSQRAALASYLPTVGINLDPDGDGTGNAKLKLSFMGVMFKVNHNVSPAAYAYGKGGCIDCHAEGAGFYNGTYEVKPRDLTINYAATDAVPFTKVNMDDYNGDGIYNGPDDVTAKGDWQYSDFHPTLFAKSSQGHARSIALSIRNGSDANGPTLRDIDRSEALWETSILKPITTTTDGSVKATRAEMVAYLDNITGSTSVHSRHAGAGYGKCANCHGDGAGNIDFGTVSDVESPFLFTYTADPLGNPGTCSANACHGNNGFSTTNYWVQPEVIPQLSALSSTDTDLVVELNASRSYCPNGCDFEFDFTDGSGSYLGGNGSDTAVVQYPAAGSYDAIVYATDTLTGEKRADSVTATAEVVEAETPTMDFATAVNGNTATLTAPTLDASVVRAYIYWGDRKRTVSTNPQADLVSGIIHTYARGGRSYNIIVETIDGAHLKTRFTTTQDADLTVAIP